MDCKNFWCIGNVDGHCCAESCRSAIIQISNRRRTREQAAKFYATHAKRLLFRLAPSTPRTGGKGAQSWPTPTAQMGKGPSNSKTRQGGPNLQTAVILYPTPITGAGLCGGSGNYQQLKALEAAGEFTEEERRNMAQGNGGQLNPDWVEWLMGFPIGWTSL